MRMPRTKHTSPNDADAARRSMQRAVLGSTPTSRLSRVVGVAALFTGAALVIHILTSISLRLTVLFSFGLVALSIGVNWHKAKPWLRAWILRRIIVGIAVCSLATTI